MSVASHPLAVVCTLNLDTHPPAVLCNLTWPIRAQDEEEDLLIYNWAPSYTGKVGTNQPCVSMIGPAGDSEGGQQSCWWSSARSELPFLVLVHLRALPPPLPCRSPRYGGTCCHHTFAKRSAC